MWLGVFTFGVHLHVFGADVDTTQMPAKRRIRIYNAVRLIGERPTIDGTLDDACWRTGEWAGDYTQWVPREGGKPSQPTEIKILYDDNNVYVAIRAFDSEPEKIIRKAGKRDEFAGDMVGVCFDSYHDHRTGFEFDVTAAGQKIDLMLTNPSNGDPNWNAVWYAKTGIEDSAWTVEFEIPLNQLRYSGEDEQVWGMHCWRWIDRFQEESDWEPQSSEGPGILYLFGEIHGIRGLPRSRRIEILPYTLGELKTYRKDPSNPFADKGRTWLGNGGVDAKIGLSSNFTADVTINPDFGQVESDPSVMNLTAFETFFEEKRPFFLEGRNIFNFDFDNVNMFYSRRIGHSPTYTPNVGDNEHLDFPDNTKILSAVKVSGKTADGLSIGALQSITSREQATIAGDAGTREVAVEPLTSYSIFRVQQDFDEGTTMLGGILTATNRFIKDPQLTFMNRGAYTGGVDLLHQWNDKEFYVDAKLVGSTIAGSTSAITALQSSSARYYQRPDVRYVTLDSSRTHLSGFGGRVSVGKGSKGFWRYSSVLNWRSPGLDLNDLGFMQTADIIKLGHSVSYFVNQPVGIFRTYTLGLNETSNWDFGMRYTSSSISMNCYLEFLNKWGFIGSLNYTTPSLDSRLLRGGYAVLVPAVWSASVYARTDPSERVFLECNANTAFWGPKGSRSSSLQPGVSVMPFTTLKLSASVNYAENIDDLQYVDTKSISADTKYILGLIRQESLGATFRIDYNVTPEVSLQYYGSPFASVGRYSMFKTVSDPRAANYVDRFSGIDPVLNGDTYQVPGNTAETPDFTFGNPDFSFGQLRSILVFRWEYLPGSQLYVVWSHERTSYVQPGDGSVGDVLGSLDHVAANNVFLMKINYWFSM